MSAIGTKRTSLVASHMSAFGGKADMPIAPINACFDVTRSPSSALATPDEVCSEVAQASSDDETDPAQPHRHRPAADYSRPTKGNSCHMEQRYYSKDHAGYYREGFLAHGSMPSKEIPKGRQCLLRGRGIAAIRQLPVYWFEGLRC
jgi:hypothetical protein